MIKIKGSHQRIVVFLLIAAVLTGCGVKASEEASSVSGSSLSESEEEKADIPFLNDGNSTNYYVIYDGESDDFGEVDMVEGILQFDRGKNLKACIPVAGMDTTIAGVEKVTDQAIYFTRPVSGEDDIDEEYDLYKIPLEKTEGDDRVCVDSMERLATLGDMIMDGSIVYLDDFRVVYEDYSEDGGYRCMKYDMETGETNPVPFVAADGAKSEGLGRAYAIYLDDGVVTTGENMDDDADRFFYYDPAKEIMAEAVLPGLRYNAKLNYRICEWAGEESIFYYPYPSVGYPFGKGPYDLYRYDKNTGETGVYLSRKQIKDLLEKVGEWRSGMDPFVSDIMWENDHMFLELEIEESDESEKQHVHYAILSGEDAADGNLTYESGLSQLGQGKGDKKVFKNRYGKRVCEDGEPVFFDYPFIGFGGGELKHRVYDLETGQWHEAEPGKLSDWYAWLLGCQEP